ncbi:MAG: hypothetical protein IPK96_12655 [Flammeovirgaceae bacterium]|jgi:uncharacterized membrane protein YphA (DoxX/SURF4 family)|nr:hypothetical protein [Flammeovirgaceae bacterium]
MEKLISRFKKIRLIQVSTIGLRYLLGASFVHASIFKIQGLRFTPQSGESAPIDSLNHFFEALYQSGPYWHFLGWSQLLAGFLLMIPAFSTLGAVVFFPVILNIFIITFSFESTSILIITFLMLLATIYLLLWDWHKLKFVVLPEPTNYVDNSMPFSKHKIWTYLGILFFLLVLLFRYLTTKNVN